MDYQIIELEEFNVIGIRYELSKSLSNNVKLAQNHWKIFNSKLRNNKLYLGSNWCKYAFIEKIENKIFYYIAIPKKEFVPKENVEIPEDYVSEMNRSVANKFTMSQSFLKYNIYEKLVKWFYKHNLWKNR